MVTTADKVVPLDVLNAGSAAVEIYIKAIENGESPRLAEMLALRSPPRCMTDSVYFSDTGTLQKQFAGDESELNRLTAIAMANGYRPNQNDHYNSSIARFPGDPEAFVPATGGRGHIQRVLEQRGWSCEGAVNVKGRQPESDPHETPVTSLGSDLTREAISEMVANDPDLPRKATKQDLIDEAHSKYGFKGE